MGSTGKAAYHGWFRVGHVVMVKGEFFRVVSVQHAVGNSYDLEHLVQGQGFTQKQLPEWMLIQELPNMARFTLGDRFVVANVFGDRWIKARWWNRTRGAIMYRLNDYLDNGRTPLVMTQDELVLCEMVPRRS